MARTAGSSGPRTLSAIMSEGLRLIYEHGYEALTIRQLATAINLTQGSIYNHLKSKQDLLYALVHQHMTDLLAELHKALSGLDDPRDRMLAFIAFHINYHATRRREVFIANSELRSLVRPNKVEILRLRKKYEEIFIDILRKANQAGIIHVSDPKIAAYAVIAMLTGINAWYNPDGALKREDLVRIHTELVLQGLGGAVEEEAPAELRLRAKTTR